MRVSSSTRRGATTTRAAGHFPRPVTHRRARGVRVVVRMAGRMVVPRRELRMRVPRRRHAKANSIPNTETAVMPVIMVAFRLRVLGYVGRRHVQVCAKSPMQRSRLRPMVGIALGGRNQLL